MNGNKIQLVIEIDEHGQPVIRSVEKDLDHLEKKVDSAGRSFRLARSHWLALTAAFTAGGYIIMRVGREIMDMADHASDLNETLSKSRTIFQDQAWAVEAWAADSASSMGLSTQAALEHTATLGNMFAQLGAGVDIAAKTSQGMVELAADVASFHNVAGGASEVLLGMQSAFRGEYDALQRYIPTINAAAVQEQALAMTHKTNAKELTNLEKALAAVQIITRDAGAAVGDFERTSGGLANQQRIMEAQIDNITAKLGNFFTPAITEAYTETNKFLDSMDEEDLRAIAEAIGNIASALVKTARGAAEYLGVWTQTWQALGLASSGAITYEQALTGASEALERFNRGLSMQAKLFSISPDTKGWDIYMQGMPAAPKSGTPEPAPSIDKNALKEIEKLEKEVWQGTIKDLTAYDDAIIQAYEDTKTFADDLSKFKPVLGPELEKYSGWWSAYGESMEAFYDAGDAIVDQSLMKIDAWHAESEAMMELIASYEMVQDSLASLISADELYISVREAVQASITAAVLGYEKFSTAMKKAIANLLAQISAEAAIRAVLHTAMGIAALTPWGAAVYGPASAQFKAAAIFATVAAAAGAAAAAMSASAGGVSGSEKTGHQESRGSGVESLGREGEKGSYAQKWDVTIVNPIGTGDWVENVLVPELKKVARTDTEITVTYG